MSSPFMVMYSRKCPLSLRNAQKILQSNRKWNPPKDLRKRGKDQYRSVFHLFWRVSCQYYIFLLVLIWFVYFDVCNPNFGGFNKQMKNWNLYIFQRQFQCRRSLWELALKPSPLFARSAFLLYKLSACPVKILVVVCCGDQLKTRQVTGVSVPYLRVALANSCWILSMVAFSPGGTCSPKITCPLVN